ncbi:hypothetical protein [Cohnella kolymensis]|uniref:hypothetical protein n=1 Tax=Cohnella kolymensis TaxID=1590652 RepID=UPI0005970E61|nr:hypothetical protein [Cohnella kolymensis]
MSKQSSANFQPSINLRFDFGKADFVDRFIPTAAHVNPFQEILKGFIEDGPKSHIISGPYGSGKSLMGVVIASLLSKKLDQSTIDKLSAKFNLVDAKVSNLINKVANSKISYIPVILEGNVHNLHRALISSIYKALKSDGTNIIMPNLISEILGTIKTWELNYPATYSLFEKKLSENKQHLKTWINQVESYDDQAITWFTNIYPELTSGAHFVPKYSGELVTQILYLLNELNKLGKGLFVVHDEFGRFLQSMNPNEINEAMQDLQDLAELASHNDYHNFNYLLISHKNMRQYAYRLSEDMQKEFQRIEKRFAIHHIESDQSTFVRIANIVTEDMRAQWNPNQFRNHIQDGLLKYNLFPELSHAEQRSLIIEQGYPLHPSSLFSMPKLANLVAQNERTLFTFLESNDAGGLRYHFDKFNDWYTPDKLFDYFEPSFDEFEHESNVKRSYLLYKRLQKRLVPSEDLEDQLKILKLITLWDITNLNTKIILSRDFLAFSLMFTEEKVQGLLDQLYETKIIRYLNDEDRFILYEGSIVDVNKEIEHLLVTSSFSVKQKLDLAEQLLEVKSYLPKLYNDEKSITRFAQVKFIDESEIGEETLSIQSNKNLDFQIVFVISDDASKHGALTARIDSYSRRHEKVIFVVYNQTFNHFYKDLETLLVIEKLQQDKVFLIQDRFLIDELNFMKRSLHYRVKDEISPFINFSPDASWLYKGEQLVVSDERTLSNNLSNIMFDLYPDTPEIRNEAFNRRFIAKVQEKNAYKVIDKILEKIKTNSEEISISGFGPDYLIYATVLKNHELDPIRPHLLKDKSLLNLRKSLLNVLKKENAPLADLVAVFRESPFAVRLPVIPVLLPALLGKEWKYLLFYNNGMFMQSVDGATLWKMVHDPENYSFAFQSIEDRYGPLITLIEECFASYIYDEDRGLQTAVYLSKVLLRWYNSLPRLARVTHKQSAASNMFRQIVRSSEMRPLEAIQQLYSFTNMGEDKLKLEAAKNESEDYLEKHNEYLESVVLSTMNLAAYSDIQSWTESQSSLLKKTSKLLSSILVSNDDNYVDSISQAIVGVSRNDWSDATDEVFQTELWNELSHLQNPDNNMNYIEINDGGASLVLPKVDLSSKSKIIYDDISRKLKYTGRTVTKDELLMVLWNLIQDISDTNSANENQQTLSKEG